MTGNNLERFVFDHVDVPSMVNYMACMAITQDIDGTDKNHFLYRDTQGTREWRMLPWDIDLTFGPNALNTDTIVYNQQSANAPPNTSHPFIGARPYLLHDGKYAKLTGTAEIFDIGMNAAVVRIAEAAAGGARSRRGDSARGAAGRGWTKKKMRRGHWPSGRAPSAAHWPRKERVASQRRLGSEAGA